MAKRILVLLVLSLALFITPSWAATCITDGGNCSNTVSPTDTIAVFDFSSGGNGVLTVQFDTVLTTFTLTVNLNNTIDPLDPTEFPTGTVCVAYSTNGTKCVEYDFSGTGTVGNGPNGVPVKNVDYKGLITLTLTYSTSQTIHTPAFGHAPGDNSTAVYTENILTSYYDPNANCFSCEDPTMGGKVPGLSAVAAFDEPTINPSTLCSLTLNATAVGNNGEKPQEEVTFKMASSCSGTGLRDKTATISVTLIDSNTFNFISFAALRNVEGNKFHWDNKNALNEYDVSLDGLSSGTYAVTVSSTRFSPGFATFVVP
jgi:hypothetical protein